MSPPRQPGEIPRSDAESKQNALDLQSSAVGTEAMVDVDEKNGTRGRPADNTETTTLDTNVAKKETGLENNGDQPASHSGATEPPSDPPQRLKEDEAHLETIASHVAEPTTPVEELMESSTATLKPASSNPSTETGKPHLPHPSQTPPDLAPSTPKTFATTSRTTPNATGTMSSHLQTGNLERSPTRSDAGFDDRSASEDERDRGDRSEIQSIMDQFSEEGGGPGEDEVMSPRLEFAGPLLGAPIQHPPRKSSLEPLNKQSTAALQSLEDLRLSTGSPSSINSRNEQGPQVPPKPSSVHKFNPSLRDREKSVASLDTPMSPTGSSIHRPPPPEPEPEPDLPFDFHRFLEQLRHRTADPVAKFLRSFLSEFGKKQWMVHEQVKIISDFLAFITNKMAQCDVWREVSDAEFDNAREGMEKLVMNRLYTQTFSPAIAPPQPVPGSRSKRKNAERTIGPGRRGQHQEDVERDDILAQKVSIYGWVQEQHLDIETVGESGRRFLILAQQELLKIKTYRAPRDKIICVLNCCKVIFGLLKHAKTDSSADSFMPLLIYVVLQANPEHLVSNVQYILRFRNQEKLGGEAGYYLSSLMGAVQFIENLDRTTLTITDEDFEKHVEAAVSAIAEKHQQEETREDPQPQFSEKAALGRPEQASRPSYEGGEASLPRKSTSSAEEETSMTGLLKTIQRPLSSIGRIFSEEGSSSQPARTPQPGNTPRLSPALRPNSERAPPHETLQNNTERPRSRRDAEDAAARQASAESAEAQRLQRAEHANVVETLAGMFPDLDRDIISDVVVQKNGRVGLAVDACLALSS